MTVTPILELMARAFDPHAWDHAQTGCPGCQDRRDVALTRAQAALDALKDAGLVVVPRNPTNGMLRAAAKSLSPGRRPTPDRVSVKQKHIIRYKAMLAAYTGELPAQPPREEE